MIKKYANRSNFDDAHFLALSFSENDEKEENQMQLKDADALKNKLNDIGQDIDVLDVLCIIDEQPTIDAVPVVHGEWIKDALNAIFRCSICSAPTCHIQNYCYNCGAKMGMKGE